MSAKLISVALKNDGPVRIKKWKVKKGMPVSLRQVIMLYENVNSRELLKYKASDVGSVQKICMEEGSLVRPGETILLLEECSHPTVMADMCAECGADLRQSEVKQVQASVPMVHSIPELKVSQELAETLGRADEARLLSDRKLVLLVDLDQTLIHTTNDNIPPNLKDVVHFQLYGPQSPWYHTRIRPGTDKFLEAISKQFELHICTFGARNYAHYIAMFLDPDGRLFSHRILSRDECFDANTKTANLKALFPCGDAMVCIIDDREDVWNYAPNLIHVKPYHFFQHTGDINAPPGLTKKENDAVEEGFDFETLGKEKTGEEANKDCEKKPVKEKPSGDTTTDKDTEDETDKKPTKTTKRFSEVVVSDKEVIHEEKDLTKPEAMEVEELEQSKTNGETTEDGQKTLSEESCNKNEINIEKSSICDTTLEDKEPEVVQIEETTAEDNKETPETDGGPKPDVVQGEEENAKEEEKAKEVGDNERLKCVQKSGKDSSEDGLIEVEDSDDYLMFLEDILKKIHSSYYEQLDQRMKENSNAELPDLKVIIPDVKRQVLAGCHLVFSGLVPSHVPLQRSRAYMVAVSLGATVSAEVGLTTTHLVAARAGTAKVNSSRRQKGVLIVTPQWLWACAERWEKVDERLFPLARGVVTARHPPAHCSSPQHPADSSDNEPNKFLRLSTDSSRFSDSINPLLSLSSEDVASMDEEVEALCRDDDTDSDQDPVQEEDKDVESAARSPVLPIKDPDGSSSSEDSLTGGRCPKGWKDDTAKPKKRKIETTTCTESDLEEESPSVKFRRGEPLPSDLDLGEDTDTQGSQEMDQDDTDWTLMGAALEREFLSGGD